MMFLVILAYGFIGFLEVPRLISDKEWKEFTVFAVLFAVGFTLTLLISLGVHIPSPIRGVIFILNDMLGISWLTFKS